MQKLGLWPRRNPIFASHGDKGASRVIRCAIWVQYFFAFLLLLSSITAEEISYFVEFEGLEYTQALKAIKSSSQLTTAKKNPTSITALRHRAISDLPEMQKILRSFGFYGAKIDFRIEESYPKTRVLVYVSTGPLYRIQSFSIDLCSSEVLAEQLCSSFDLASLGVQLNAPARSKTIVAATEKLLSFLADSGYPLASLTERDVIVDGKTHLVNVRLKIRTGPLCFFGPLEITGTSHVNTTWLREKLDWQEGEIYDQRKLQETQKKLIDTTLFSSVIITANGNPDASSCLPLKLELAETLHRSVNGGISYQTKFGLGVTFGWEHRNINQRGEILSLKGDLTRLSHSGILAYRIPDFRRRKQDLSTELQALHEDIEHVYSERAYVLTSRLERQIGKYLRFSVGGRAERMYVTESLDNGKFTLLQMPLYAGFADVNNILNPSKGISLDYALSPTINFDSGQRFYMEQRLSQGCYFPIKKTKDRIILAQKITVASILSSKLNDVPIPERLLGGSEDDLRGYGYLTVSPLGLSSQGSLKPLGGRSAIFYTFETRLRVTESIGLVPFFDLGNVWLNVIPSLNGRWFKSLGLGLRYFTFIGPLRFDIGFPLNRRPGLDNRWRIWVSIGQSF